MLVSGSVERLKVSDAAAVVELLKAASRRAALLGSILWTDEQVNHSNVSRLAERNEVFGWVSHGEILACVVLQTQDEVHWPEDQSGEALYLHKLAARPSACGQGIGTILIDFACSLARGLERPWLRLDTVPGSRLVDYYERHGFRADANGPADYGGRWLIRMERKLIRRPRKLRYPAALQRGDR